MVSPYASSDRPEVHELIPSSARRVLDVGAHDGTFAAWLRRQSAHREICCVEPDVTQAERARRHCDLVVCDLYPGALRQLPGSFDCVTFNHVLEHMADPWDALARTRDRLSESGCVVAIIPNVRYLPVAANLFFRGRWDYARSGHLDKTHLRFFTRSSIPSLFDYAHFKIETLRPTNRIGSVRAPIPSLALGYALRDLAYGAFVVRAYPA